jgi:antitoxin component YwqK of YwqJK toxin-antitoxin module
MGKFSPFKRKFSAANKFSNKKVEVDEIIFDSKKEAEAYLELKEQKEKGEIKDFKMQVTFELVPAQRGVTTKPNKKGVPITKERVVEHPVTYTADFVVYHNDGEVTVVDCKGSRGLDQKYPIKRKLMRWLKNIVILEV